MKLSIEANPDELQDRSDELVRAFSDLLYEVAPDIAEKLEKSLPHKEPELKYQVLREILKRTAKLYSKHTRKMLKEIGQVLDQNLIKATTPEDLDQIRYDHTKPIAEKDGIGYRRVKDVLLGMDYKEADFEEGGVLYGKSVNELLDMIREKK